MRRFHVYCEREFFLNNRRGVRANLPHGAFDTTGRFGGFYEKGQIMSPRMARIFILGVCGLLLVSGCESPGDKQEAEKLRQENARLRDGIEQYRAALDVQRGEAMKLQGRVEALETENARLRGELAGRPDLSHRETVGPGTEKPPLVGVEQSQAPNRAELLGTSTTGGSQAHEKRGPSFFGDHEVGPTTGPVTRKVRKIQKTGEWEVVPENDGK
jgi:hypothetical protein